MWFVFPVPAQCADRIFVLTLYHTLAGTRSWRPLCNVDISVIDLFTFCSSLLTDYKSFMEGEQVKDKLSPPFAVTNS